MESIISRKGWLLMGATVGLLVLVCVVGTVLAQGPGGDEPVPPTEPPQGTEVLSPSGGPGYSRGFTYQGYLENGGAPANGNYDLYFALYTAQTGGSLVVYCYDLAGAEFDNIYVDEGFFTVTMICLPTNSDNFTGDNFWLQTWVRPAGGSTWTALPRQPISSVPYAFSLIPGAIIRGAIASPSAVFSVTQTYNAYPSTSAFGIYGSGPGTGIYGRGGDYGVRGFGLRYGMYGESGYIGVYGWSDGPTGAGVYGYATRAGVEGVGYYGVRANGYIAFYGSSNDGNLIELYDGNPWNRRFDVSNAGDVHADGTYTSPASDLAEMLPASEGLEPGDVLVIGADGLLTRSTTAYQANVLGVYSTQPAFLGGASEDEAAGQVPLAVVGVVPVKVSAENGPIVPGDLLVASSTPGHAMRADANPPVGTVIGKALEGLESGTGVIRMLVVLQ